MQKPSDSSKRIVQQFFAKEKLTQQDLADELGLEKSTISRIFKKLHTSGLLLQAGEYPASERGGRKTHVWQLNSQAAHVLSVSFNIENTRFAWVNLQGEVEEYRDIESPRVLDEASILAYLVEEIDKTLNDHRDFQAKCIGIALGLPGLVDSQTGVAISAVNLPGWRDVPISQHLEKALGYPVEIDNQLRYRVMGESWVGEGRECDHYLCVSVEFGIGLAVMSHGRVLRGAHDQAGDVHVQMRPDGPECRCGRRGCIEALAGSRIYLERLKDREVQSTRDLVTLAKNGDEELLRYSIESAGPLGELLANLSEMFDPQKVLLTGPLVSHQAKYFEEIKLRYSEYYLKDRRFDAPELLLLPSSSLDLIGGAKVVFDRHLLSCFEMKSV